MRQYVKYPRLNAGLKKLVEKGDVELKVALNAQDLAERLDGKVPGPDLVKLAKGMGTMSRAQRAKFMKAAARSPEASVDELLAGAEDRAAEVSQIIVTLPKAVHEALKTQAKEQGVTQDEAAAAIIVRQLTA